MFYLASPLPAAVFDLHKPQTYEKLRRRYRRLLGYFHASGVGRPFDEIVSVVV